MPEWVKGEKMTKATAICVLKEVYALIQHAYCDSNYLSSLNENEILTYLEQIKEIFTTVITSE